MNSDLQFHSEIFIDPLVVCERWFMNMVQVKGSADTLIITAPVSGLALGVLLSSKYFVLSCSKSSITLFVT